MAWRLLRRAFMRVLGLLIAFFVHGCVAAYVSPAPVAPLHTKRNDVSGAAVVRPFFPRLGAHAQVAWSATDRWLLTASGTLTRYRDSGSQRSEVDRIDPYGIPDGDSDLDLHGVRAHQRAHLFDVGIGHSTAWKRHRLEFLAAAGAGYLDMAECSARYFSVDDDETCDRWNESKGSFARGSFQGHYGLQYRFLEVATGARFSLVRYDVDQLYQQPSDRVAYLGAVEPFFVVRGGADWIKGQLMVVVPLTFDTKSSKFDGETLDPAQPPYIVVGIHLSTKDRWRTPGATGRF